MIKKDLALIVSDRTGLNYTEALRVVEAVLKSVKNALTDGESVIVRGFGSFQAKFRPRRKGRNPKTGVEAMISPGRSVMFKASKKLIASLNHKLNQF